MDLKPFIATHVNPGEPVTAQAWNDIVDAVDGAYKFLQSTAHVVRVKVTANPPVDSSLVRVIATRDAGTPFAAVPPVAPSTEHVLAGLDPGAYTIVVQAPGFAVSSQAIVISDAGETTLEIPLVALGPFMPDLFGAKLSDALAALAAATIPVTRILDFNGNEIAANDPNPQNTGAPVLVQAPPAGTAMFGGASARLVVAVPIAIEPAVEVPSLAGLTQLEAQKALEAIGLVLGRVDIRQGPGGPGGPGTNPT